MLFGFIQRLQLVISSLAAGMLYKILQKHLLSELVTYSPYGIAVLSMFFVAF